MEKLNCKKCGHIWVPRVNNPAECPKCKSYLWGNKNDTLPKTTKRTK